MKKTVWSIVGIAVAVVVAGQVIPGFDLDWMMGTFFAGTYVVVLSVLPLRELWGKRGSRRRSGRAASRGVVPFPRIH